jgi:hypothetical protein
MSQLTVDRDAGMIAYEINIIKDQANKYLLHSSIEIGRRLFQKNGIKLNENT